MERQLRMSMLLVLVVVALGLCGCGDSGNGSADPVSGAITDAGSCAACHTDQVTLVALAVEEEPAGTEDAGET
jgi:hypothetical protein